MSDFLSLLPTNATEFEKLIEQATANVSDIPVNIRHYYNTEKIPANLMPWLGFEWSVDVWSSDWPDYEKRSVLNASFYTHQKKGTLSAIKKAINAIGPNIFIREWFEENPKKNPYTFIAYVSASRKPWSITYELQESIEKAIEKNKPVRAHYNIIAAQNYFNQLNVIGAGLVCNYKRLVIS